MRQTKTTPRQSNQFAQPSRLKATALDAAAVAVSTALIIGMVGSLVFFLIIAFYRGEYDGRLMYIFGLYTAATVLVARIAIESGRSYANAFSLPLAVVSVLAIMRFVTVSGGLAPLSWIINLGLLAITWILADRITFDCTLISERQRSPQQGLLQSLGLLRSDRFESSDQFATVQKKRRHNPGVWVLYFALLAFPLFGLGQLAIPDENQRSWAFAFLIAYLASALSLLVLTSLMGMRRYLRQRGVAMPTQISLHWLGFGVGSVLVLLLVCLMLPLPGRSLGLVGLPAGLQSPDALGSSRWGWGNEGAEQQPVPDAAGVPRDRGAAPPNVDQPNVDQPNVDQPKVDPDGADGPPRPDGKGAPAASPQAGKNSAGADSTQRGRSTNDAPDESAAESSGPQKDSVAPPRGGAQSAKKSTSSSSSSPSSEDPPQQAQQGNPPADPPASPAEDTANPPPPTDEGQAAAEESSDAAAPPNSAASNPLSNLLPQFGSFAELFKWLTLLVLAAIVILYVVTHPAEIAQLWRDLLGLLAALLGRKRAPKATGTTIVDDRPSPAPRRSFSTFVDPFASPSAAMTPIQIVEHSFAALEAWAAERGVPRAEQQTAAEFARHVADASPAVGQHAQAAATLLDQVMFASWQPRAEDLKPLAQLWRSFAAHPAKPVSEQLR